MKAFLHSACRLFAGAFLLAALVPVVAGANVAFAETKSAVSDISPSATLAASGYDYTKTTDKTEGLGIAVSWNTPKGGTPTVFHLEGLRVSGECKYYLNGVWLNDSGYYTQVVDPSRLGGYQTSPDISFTFYASGMYRFRFYVMGSTDSGYEFDHIDVDVQVNDPAYPSVQARVNTIAKQCEAAGNKTDFNKAVWLHDWILDNCTYDGSLLYCGAEGALARGTGTCESYHRAYVMLLNAVGINTGRIEDKVNWHVWTAVKLDGKWYQVDATWDDTRTNPSYPDLRHLYFGMNDRIASLVHSGHQPVEGYESNSLELNYFVKTGEIKQWSDPYVARFDQAVKEGKSSFTVTIDHSGWPPNYKNALYNVVAYDLSQRSWKKADGSSASLEVSYADNVLSAKVVANPSQGTSGGSTTPGTSGSDTSGSGNTSPSGSATPSPSGSGNPTPSGSANPAPSGSGATTPSGSSNSGASGPNGSSVNNSNGSSVNGSNGSSANGSNGSSANNSNGSGANSTDSSISGNNVAANNPAYSPAGNWVFQGGGWWYRHHDGSYTSSDWELIDGKWYRFDHEGWMLTGWLGLSSAWYFLDDAGAMVEGWQWIDGAWYYLYEGSGVMATGWANHGGTWYYHYSSGAMATGWANHGGIWYYHYGSGAMATGWIYADGTWYYLYDSGAMAANTWAGSYYLDGSGAMVTNAWIGPYHVNSSGQWDATR